jgi:hypothetical protein
VLEIPAGGGFSGGGSGGGGGGGGNHRPNLKKLDVKRLMDCISALFGVSGTSFTQTTKTSAGRFTGTLNSNSFSVQNFQGFNAAQLTSWWAQSNHRTPPSGFVSIGLTIPSAPYFNFTANDAASYGYSPLTSQVYELGNSLGVISGTLQSNPNQMPGPGNTEPGNALLNCITNTGAFAPGFSQEPSASYT